MKLKSLLLIPAASLFLSSCHSWVYDDQEPCEVKYYMHFVYDMNLKWADAFPSEVSSVNLYAFDENGVFVKEYIGRGEALSQPGYAMELDLEPGKYQFVAWCGLYNDGKDMESFTVEEPEPGVTKIEDLTCRLNTLSNSQYGVYSDKRLYFMYHGYLQEELPEIESDATFDYTMHLTKDTNHIRIILQQLSGDSMVPSEFSFRIEDSDGYLAYDNSLLGDTEITYLDWNKMTAQAGVPVKNPDGETEISYINGVAADLSVSRMMADHQKEFFLTVYNTATGADIITKVPVIQYALLSKEYYELAYNHTMTDQEFLDREDEYVLTFFLDENMSWIKNMIYIHSWRIINHDYNFDWD